LDFRQVSGRGSNDMEKYAWRGDYKMKRLGDDLHLT